MVVEKVHWMMIDVRTIFVFYLRSRRFICTNPLMFLNDSDSSKFLLSQVLSQFKLLRLHLHQLHPEPVRTETELSNSQDHIVPSWPREKTNASWPSFSKRAAIVRDPRSWNHDLIRFSASSRDQTRQIKSASRIQHEAR